MIVQELPQTVINGPVHEYIEVEKRDVDNFIVSYKLPTGKIEYECRHHACKGRRDNSLGPASFTSKSNAREHVYRDMDITNRFLCTVCPGRYFASEDSARRHRESKKAGKIYSCSYCGRAFERKDYCKSHEEDEKCHKGAHSVNRLSYPPSPHTGGGGGSGSVASAYRDDYAEYRDALRGNSNHHHHNHHNHHNHHPHPHHHHHRDGYVSPEYRNNNYSPEYRNNHYRDDNYRDYSMPPTPITPTTPAYQQQFTQSSSSSQFLPLQQPQPQYHHLQQTLPSLNMFSSQFY